MKNIILFSTFLLLMYNPIYGQVTHFVTSGSIEFEKKVNIYVIIKKSIPQNNDIFLKALESYKQDNPQFKTLHSTLRFSNNKTLFLPLLTDDNSQDVFGNSPIINQNNIIYDDFATGNFICQKKVFEQTFLVKDSIRKIKWKITDETREIAGYACRRANAIILDSIYVVAFYTLQIPVSGGPESFNGLPGMILGVALPHENISWFAKTVNEEKEPVSPLKPPTKGKVVDEKGLIDALSNDFKNWGQRANAYLKAFIL